ncbi:ROK family transcriptional regulator [Microbacterium sp. W1N]|uniref:ROK family transcriptional regulator n=1 Tax=Microbacterium festucae TaxID=2977531 RepID=UPI0021C15673|nr:ROK family transcriptional regulator [Microbacterium festucae]MCT9821213.1 ROK family transcriptional regulator [Microbacterium festucae]
MVVPSPLSIVARAALHLRDAGPATVTELSRSLEISRTSVENAVAVLIDSGLIGDAPVHSGSGAGRPARRYSFHAAVGTVVGVDIGVASVRVILADLAGRVTMQRTFAGVEDYVGGAAKLAAVIDDVRQTLAGASVPASKVRAIGVSLPGIIDDAGRVTLSVVIPEWSGIDIGSQLRQAFGCPVAVDNGVRLAAVAEHHLGVAQLVDDVIYLSVGNRIAMGLILGGRPRRGIHNAAGDIGRLAFRGLDTETGQIRWQTAATAAEVFDAARAGDVAAQGELDAFVDELAHGIATLIMTIDPAMIVIGGGLSGAHEQLLGPLRAVLPHHLGLPFHVPLAEARLGAEAAAHGALVHAFQRHNAEIYRIDDMPVPPITPLRGASAAVSESTEENE